MNKHPPINVLATALIRCFQTFIYYTILYVVFYETTLKLCNWLKSVKEHTSLLRYTGSYGKTSNNSATILSDFFKHSYIAHISYDTSLKSCTRHETTLKHTYTYTRCNFSRAEVSMHYHHIMHLA